MTKHLSPEDYGVLAIFNATTRFLVAILSLGSLNILMVKLIEEKKSVFSVYIKSFVGIITINALVLFIVLGVSSFFIDNFFGLPIWLMLLLPFFAWLIVVYDGMTTLLMFKKKLKRYAILALSKFFAEILLSLFLIVSLGLNWSGRISGVAFSLVIAFVITIYYLKKKKLHNGKFDQQKYKELIKHGAPLILMNLSVMVMNLSDRFYIESMVSIEETGMYSIGAIIGGIELIVINAMISALRPLIYKSLRLNKRTIGLQMLNGTLLFATGCCIVLSLNIIFYFLDEQYLPSKIFVLPIVAGFFFWGIYNFYISYFIYFKKTKSIATISTIGVIINLVLNFFLIKQYSTIGAAYATTITYFIMAIAIFTIFVFNASRSAKAISENNELY